MIKGFAITPIVEGRIGIGEVVENNGKKMPKKLDHIVITKNFQANGSWQPHPEMDRLIQLQKDSGIPNSDKLRSIPVRIMFDRPENNFRAEYTCFNDKGRTVCSGDGVTAHRRSGDMVSDVPCPGADICDFGIKNRCKQFGRLMVGMEGSFQNDPLSGFMFRTTSFNSIRSLTFRLKALAAATGGKIAGMPCNLVMKAKSTAASFRKPVFYLDLEPRGGIVAAARDAYQYRADFASAGLDRDALEVSVSEGLSQSEFYEAGDDGEEVVEEFYFSGDDDSGPEKSGNETNSGIGLAVNSAQLATPEQVSKIDELIKEKGKDIDGLMNWLIKPKNTSLSDLTSEEADRAIHVLSEKPVAEKQKVKNKAEKDDGEIVVKEKFSKTADLPSLPKSSPLPLSKIEQFDDSFEVF